MLRIGILQWAAGGFCGLIGALTFVTPHQFVGPTYALLQPFLPWWGALCLLGGGVLLAAALLAPRGKLLVAAHALAALPIALLASSAGLAGVTSALVVYLGLSLGTALAPLVMPGPSRPVTTGDLFAVVVGASAVVNGLVMVALPDRYASPVFDGVRPYLSYYGIGFVVGGIGVVWTQLRANVGKPVFWASHLLLGTTMITFGPPLALTARAFTSIAYYDGFGSLITGLPLLRARLRRSDPRSLRTRLALAFGLAVSVPLVLTMALVTDQIERSARTEALSRTQILAETLAFGISDYVDLHRAAVAALAAQPGLLAAEPGWQRQVLRAFNETYPDAVTFVLYDADGRAVARSDDVPLQTPPSFRSPLFDEVRQSGGPGVRVVVSQVGVQPVVALGVPIRLADGSFGGMATVVIESTRLADVARRASPEPGDQVRLVDRQGRLIAASDEASLPPATVLSDHPAVVALARGNEMGSLSYGPPASERLAGFATVPPVGWGVVVERPAALALEGARSGRDLAFGILLVVIATAAVLGWIAAGQLASPLETLIHAVDALAVGTSPTDLPRSRVTEVARLAAVFGDLRDRLHIRTHERERADRRLRFLADASSHLAASLDYATTLERVAWLAVPMLADWCLVDIVEDDGEIVRVEVAHADRLRGDEAAELRKYPPDRRAGEGIAKVMRTGVPELIHELPDSRLPATTRDARHQTLVRGLGAHSLMRVPMLARGRTLGVLSFISTDPARLYGSADLALAEELGRRCAMAVDNARLYAEAQQAIRTRDEFLSIASHELRTPLTGIKGYAQILLRAQARGQLDEERLLRSLATIDESADRLTTLISDLLDVSRIRTGHLPLRLQTVDLGTTLRLVADRYRDHLDGEHQIVLNLPETPTYAEVDVDRVEQVITNLLSNAVKYSPAGGAVSLTLTGGEGGALVEVSDGGIGLPRENLETIFQPFGRAPNATRRSLPGMGLGLYICRTLVERQGGRIWATSGGENLGTTFGFWLPRPEKIPTLEPAHAQA
jgi:signal transduction histidine kinase